MLSDSSSDASSIYRKQQVSAKPIPEFKLNALSPEEEQAKILEEIRLKYLEDARTQHYMALQATITSLNKIIKRLVEENQKSMPDKDVVREQTRLASVFIQNIRLMRDKVGLELDPLYKAIQDCLERIQTLVKNCDKILLDRSKI